MNVGQTLDGKMFSTKDRDNDDSVRYVYATEHALRFCA